MAAVSRNTNASMETSSFVRRCRKRKPSIHKGYEALPDAARHARNRHLARENRSNLAPNPLKINHSEMQVVSGLIGLSLCLAPFAGMSQEPSATPDVAHMERDLQETRTQLAESQRQIEELRREVEDLRHLVSSGREPRAEESSEPTTAAADQDPTFLAAKVAELHQDKVESTSKYPVKVSGLILFNSYINAGNVSAADLPVLAFPRAPGSANGSIGATLNQTILGLEVKGPSLLGAGSSGDVSVDFSGGSPTVAYGMTAGLVRLRTANARLQWKNTTFTLGQDTPFFSPLSPTSYASIAEPSFSWAGNLWVWTPQAYLEHRLTVSENATLVLEGGLLDPLTEEIPPFQGRVPTAGELTRAPGIAGRIAFENRSSEHPLLLGVGAYRARQRYESFPQITSWTVNTDFTATLNRFAEISGEGYKGQAVGGLGGGIWSSVAYPEPSTPHTAIVPLRSVGGWVQLKLKPLPQFETNAALGQDENYSQDLHLFPVPFTVDGFPPFQKNQAQFVNFIYKPRESLILALEYRHLRTTMFGGVSASGEQVNLAAGVHF